MSLFTIENFRIAWNQCRKYNYKNYMNFGLIGEIEFYDKHINTIIADIIYRINSKSYVFSNKYVTYIPKSNNLLRRISVSTLEDQLLMQVILNRISRKIDRKFIKNSFGNRIEFKKGKLSTAIFKPYYIQFNKFINKTINSIERGYNWICETDITSFFDTINLNHLENIIKVLVKTDNAIENEYIIELIMNYLNSDIIENGQVRKVERGIPQNSSFSAFISNMYLNEIDYKMVQNKNIIYLRYVDDIRIIGKCKKDLIDALLFLQKELLTLDLYINSSKTKIYEIDTNNINRSNLRKLQLDKLSIQNISEKNFLKEFVVDGSNSSSEKEIIVQSKESFKELNELIDRKNTMIKHKLIKQNKSEYYKYLADFIENNPKYYYLIQSLKKYKYKVNKRDILELYRKIINSPYDVIIAQGIADILNDSNFFGANINLNNIENFRVIAILLQITDKNEYKKKLIKNIMKSNDNINIIFKQIILILEKINESYIWKNKLLNKLTTHDFLIRDNYLFLTVMMDGNLTDERILDFIKSNYPCTYKSIFLKKNNYIEKNIYDNISEYDSDICSLAKIINTIYTSLPSNFIDNPSYINPYNISIDYDLFQNISVKFKNDDPIEICNKIPEAFIGSKSTISKKISYMLGILWLCMLVNDPIDMYNSIVPYEQFSAINFYRNNRHKFRKRLLSGKIDKEHKKDLLLQNTINIIDRLIRKTPSLRLKVDEALNIKIGEKKMSIKNYNDEYIKILHLSDIHFGIEPTNDRLINNNQVAERELVLRGLKKKLKELDKEWEPDSLIISGDIAWRGKKGDYELAKVWLEELLQSLNINPNRMIVCPGNHDLDREIAKSRNVPRTSKDADQFLSNDDIDGYKDYFNEFENFANEMKVVPYQLGSSKCFLSGIRIIDKFRFIILNSAWFSRGKEDCGNLWIGLPLIKLLDANDQITNDDDYINIGILHHPKECLAYDEIHTTSNRRNTYNYLAEMTHLILSGHVHAKPEKSDTLFGLSHLILGGSTYMDDNYENNCSIIRINKSNMEFDRTVLQYNPSDGKWIIDYDFENKSLIRKSSK